MATAVYSRHFNIEKYPPIDPTQITLMASYIAKKVALDLRAIHQANAESRSLDTSTLQKRLCTEIASALFQAFDNPEQLSAEGFCLQKAIFLSMKIQDYTRIFSGYSAKLTRMGKEIFVIKAESNAISSTKTFTLNKLEKEFLKRV